MAFNSEPAFAHDAIARTGVLLVNLGTPEAPTPAAVRTYLKEFLSDPRVVEIPRAVWWPILNGIILNVRPRKSARKYASIWTPEGSPLRVHTERQAKLLKGLLGTRLRSPMAVTFAMRYGEPSIAGGIAELKAANCTRILVVPMYPQYAASTTATALDMVFEALARTRNVPELRVVRSFPSDPGYIEALAEQVREFWRANGRPDRLVMSFHGLPLYTLQRGDPYHCECHVTGRRLAEALELKPDQWILTFQSRFGKAEWLKPYTAPTLEDLGRKGVKRVDVITPGFVADCLETLEEIAMEGREIFLQAGGQTFNALPCLNERPSWIRALAGIVTAHLHGWASEQWDAPADQAARTERQARARALGAAG